MPTTAIQTLMNHCIFRIFVVLLAGLACLTQGCGTSGEVKERLDLVETVMDQNPDSAALLLSEIDPSRLHHPADTLRYLLLDNFVRYKNFDDSLDLDGLKRAAEYFGEHNQPHNAMLSLLMAGRVQTLKNMHGQAAVSLLQAAELAEKLADSYYEGLVHYAMYTLYSDFYDSSHQLFYSRKAFEAFTRAGRPDWAEYARMGITISYHNAKHETKALEEAEVLRKNAVELGDSSLATRALLMAAISSADSLPHLSAKYYAMALETDSLLFDQNDWYVLSDLIDKNGIELFSDSARCDIARVRSHIDAARSCKYYAERGDYHEAFRRLDIYVYSQEQLIERLLLQNVGGSIETFHDAREQAVVRERRAERTWSYIWIFFLFMCIVLILLWLQAKTRGARLQRKQYMVDVERLTSIIDGKDSVNTRQTAIIKELYGARFQTLNRLCESYYEDKNDRRVINTVKNMIQETAEDTMTLAELSAYLDRYTSSLISDFRIDFPDLRPEALRLYIYIVAGFSVRSIAVLLDCAPEVVYNRKSRLKKSIDKSCASRRDDYLSYL